MKVRAITKDGNSLSWRFGQGLSCYKTEQNAIEQDVYCALLEWKNDCFFDLEAGIDWRTRLGSKNQKELLDVDIVNIIENRYGVLSVTDFVSNVIDRVYTCQCEVFTIFSESFTLTFSNEV